MSSHFKPGSILARKYRILRTIGEGGMGIVLAATHIELNRLVAIKLVRKDAVDPGRVERLMREARAAAALSSPHVARVLDVGRTADGEPYLVLEYLEGEDLHARIQSGPPARIADVASWILQVCEGLAEAHARGIVHRDLKPGNLFLAKQPGGDVIVKVLDFGLAKHITGTDDGRVTQTGAILGSPSYMSPEQLSGLVTDPRSDVWSLGVTMYELLTGVVPFQGRTTPEICAAVLSTEPLSVAARRHDVPRELDDVVMACLHKRVELRPRDVAELAASIEPFSEGGAGRAARVADILTRKETVGAASAYAAPFNEVPTRVVSTIDTPPSAARGRTRWLAFGGVLVVAVTFAIVRSRTGGHVARPSEVVEDAEARPVAVQSTPSPFPSAISIEALPTASHTAARPRIVVRPHPSVSATASATDPLGRF